MANAIRSVGIECYIILATTRIAFSSAELELLKEFVRTEAALPPLDADTADATRAGVVLLAAAQLDYHRHVPLMKQDNVPGRRARTMHDLALVTQAIHVGDAPVDVALGPDDYLI